MIRLRKLHEQRLPFALDGALFGSLVPMSGFAGLVGQAVTFANPAFTHTFTPSTVVGNSDVNLLFLPDITGQLRVASAGLLSVYQVDRYLVFVETTPTTGVAMSAAAEVGKRILGIPPLASGQRIWPLGSGHSPQLVQTFQSHDGNIACVMADSADLVTVPTGQSAPAVAGQSAVVSATAAKLWSLKVTNVTAVDRWFLIFNKGTLPVNGDVPVFPLYVPAHGTGELEWLHGLSLSNGLAWASSTDSSVLALPGTNDFWPVIGYSN